MKSAPHTLSEAIPTLCTVQDVCRILQIGKSRFYELLAEQAFPFAEVHPRIGGPRFNGEDIQRWKSGFYAERRPMALVK